MRYRDARKLSNSDEVIRKSDQQKMLVVNIEIFGQYKKVKINCVIPSHIENIGGTYLSVFNDEVE